MNVMQQALIQACDNLSIPYEILHKDQIVVRVEVNGRRYHYIHWFLPFNRADVQRILRDKDLQYALLKDVIQIPAWKAYLDPAKKADYPYAVGIFADIDTIVQDVIKDLSLPVLVKPNMRAQGVNVKVCTNEESLSNALQDIFDRANRGYSYIAVVQKYVDIRTEYRVLAYNMRNLLTYKKDTSSATFGGNVSPLHWEGARAVHITDNDIQSKLEKFIAPVFSEIGLVYGGFDIAEDHDGNLWLLEINRIPGVGIFVRDNGLEPVVKMHEEILKELMSLPHLTRVRLGEPKAKKVKAGK